MRISEHFSILSKRFPHHLKCIRKGIFYILLEEEAFFVAEKFSFRLTPLDRTAIKIGFPKNSLSKWKNVFMESGWAFILVDGENIEEYPWIYPLLDNPIDIEAYSLVKQRILRLWTVGIEDRETKRFLLKERFEELFAIVNGFLMKISKKERYFLREKIETKMLEILENIYQYMYNPSSRIVLSEKLFSDLLILREFLRFTRRMGHLHKDVVYLDVTDRCLELLKIMKAIREKNIIKWGE